MQLNIVAHKPVQPFLKWAGGKRSLLKHILQHVPGQFGRYFEPFLGGGAVFFAARPKSAFLSDVNGELINAYLQVRDSLDPVIHRLKAMTISTERFYQIRSTEFTDPLDRAVRFIYLNRTAYNGLYRVNLGGKFNVPYGCKPGTVLCEEETLRAASAALKSAGLLAVDFEETLNEVGPGDFVYCDPPYTVKHANNGFRKYNEAIFSWADQTRLSHCLQHLVGNGAYVIVSNAYHQDLRDLYSSFSPVVVSRSSVISGKASARGRVQEYLFVSQNICAW